MLAQHAYLWQNQREVVASLFNNSELWLLLLTTASASRYRGKREGRGEETDLGTVLASYASGYTMTFKITIF